MLIVMYPIVSNFEEISVVDTVDGYFLHVKVNVDGIQKQLLFDLLKTMKCTDIIRKLDINGCVYDNLATIVNHKALCTKIRDQYKIGWRKYAYALGTTGAIGFLSLAFYESVVGRSQRIYDDHVADAKKTVELSEQVNKSIKRLAMVTVPIASGTVFWMPQLMAACGFFLGPSSVLLSSALLVLWKRS